MNEITNLRKHRAAERAVRSAELRRREQEKIEQLQRELCAITLPWNPVTPRREMARHIAEVKHRAKVAIPAGALYL